MAAAADPAAAADLPQWAPGGASPDVPLDDRMLLDMLDELGGASPGPSGLEPLPLAPGPAPRAAWAVPAAPTWPGEHHAAAAPAAPGRAPAADPAAAAAVAARETDFAAALAGLLPPGAKREREDEGGGGPWPAGGGGGPARRQTWAGADAAAPPWAPASDPVVAPPPPSTIASDDGPTAWWPPRMRRALRAVRRPRGFGSLPPPPGDLSDDALPPRPPKSMTRMLRTACAVFAYLKDGPRSEAEVRARLGNTQDVSKGLRRLLTDRLVARDGRGGRQAPFVYTVSPRGATTAHWAAALPPPPTPLDDLDDGSGHYWDAGLAFNTW
jgi:hypothetical protein